MDADDVEPRKGADQSLNIVLDDFSVEDLKARIEALREEITRCEAAIKAREASKSAAESVFKT